MSGRYYSPSAHEVTKSNIIEDLKIENHALRHDDANIEVLEETLHSVQYALDKATGSRLKLENDFKIQVDNDAITVNRLKNEGIDLKHTLADRNEEIARLRSTLSNLKYTVDLKSGDLAHLKEEFRINKEDNDHLKAVANGLDMDIKTEIDVNNDLKDKLDDLRDRIDRGEIRQRELDNLNSTSRKNQDRLSRDIDDIEHRIRDITAQISVLDNKARGFRIDLDHLEGKCGDLAGKLDAEIDLSNKVRPDLDAEIRRGKDLEAAHAKLITNIEDGRRELQSLRRELDDLNIQVRDLTGSNADLEYQINELKRHIDVLSKQNEDLNIELKEILIKDQQVQDELNRRKTIIDKQRLNEDSLLKSLATLQMNKSKAARTSQSPNRELISNVMGLMGNRK